MVLKFLNHVSLEHEINSGISFTFPFSFSVSVYGSGEVRPIYRKKAGQMHPYHSQTGGLGTSYAP